MIRWKPLLISLGISLGVGALSGAIVSDAAQQYQALQQPPGAPPAWLFPVVWTILFFLMGISAYLVWISESPERTTALKLYGAQLVINFVWPLLFFSAQQYFGSFVWLVLLWIFVAAMIVWFYQINPVAAWLQLPYLFWLTYAGYLNLMVYRLNT
ncbi:MAG: TspO/MBR family protein [Acutalibacteraceae bacterium]|jgi:benzodiazapine receptor